MSVLVGASSHVALHVRLQKPELDAGRDTAEDTLHRHDRHDAPFKVAHIHVAAKPFVACGEGRRLPTVLVVQAHDYQPRLIRHGGGHDEEPRRRRDEMVHERLKRDGDRMRLIGGRRDRVFV